MAEAITVGDARVRPGSRVRTAFPVARLFTGDMLSLPVTVLHGRESGPRLWLSAAIHGDELNGMEVIHRVLERLDPGRLRGTLLAVPVVNVFGFVHQSRYFPDRRDLNRSFPGSRRGSLAARLANLFMREIVGRCERGLDLHTGSHHRTNLPQVRADLTDAETRRLALAFGAPLVSQAKPLRGSLRSAARRRGIQVLVYEAGEPLRFDSRAVATGVRGVLNVLAALEMWSPGGESEAPGRRPFIADSTRWLRAARSGILHLDVELGDAVEKGQVLGRIADPFTDAVRRVKASAPGIVIGYTNNPLVHQGDALVHLARVSEVAE